MKYARCTVDHLYGGKTEMKAVYEGEVIAEDEHTLTIRSGHTPWVFVKGGEYLTIEEISKPSPETPTLEEDLFELSKDWDARGYALSHNDKVTSYREGKADGLTEAAWRLRQILGNHAIF